MYYKNVMMNFKFNKKDLNNVTVTNWIWIFKFEKPKNESAGTIFQIFVKFRDLRHILT